MATMVTPPRASALPRALGVSAATVKRDRITSRLWRYNELTLDEDAG